MVRNKHPGQKQLVIHLISIDRLSIDYASSTGLGSRGPLEINKTWSVPQEACGRHRLPLKKEFAPLAGSMVCREPLVVCCSRDYIKGRELPSQGHSLPRWTHSMTDCCTGAEAWPFQSRPELPHQWSSNKVYRSGQFFPLFTQFFCLPQVPLPNKHPIPLHYLSEKETCDRAKLNTMTAIYQVRSSGSKY